MPDEYPTRIRIAGEQPAIPVGTAVDLSGPNGHAKFAPCSRSYPYRSGRRSATGVCQVRRIGRPTCRLDFRVVPTRRKRTSSGVPLWNGLISLAFAFFQPTSAATCRPIR
jgi:hypothetical protein